MNKRGLTRRKAPSGKTNGQKFGVCYRGMRTLPSTRRCDPKCARFAAPPAGFDGAIKDHHVLIGGVCMGRDDGATREACAMNWPFF